MDVHEVVVLFRDYLYKSRDKSNGLENMIFFTTSLRRLVTSSAVVVSVVFGTAMAATAQTVTLNGAGAAEFAKQNPTIKINYQGIGSSGGIKQFTAGTVDFGGSDAAMTDEQIAAVSKGVILVPTAGGAVAVIFNVPGVEKLKLSRFTLPGIFTGQIKRWNDPKLVRDNPGVTLPDLAIRLAVRADGSGTTYIFSNHLSAIDASFRKQVGVNTAPKWIANPLKGKGNSGVAGLVKQTSGAIGYVEYSFAKNGNLETATLQNKKGQYVTPELANANKALSTFKFPENFRVFDGDPTDGYPIVGLTWLMVAKSYEPAKAAAVKKFVQWALTSGQKINGSLEYTEIPDAVAKRAVQAVNSSVK
jgi:phosphate transport system substrate-binding protein